MNISESSFKTRGPLSGSAPAAARGGTGFNRCNADERFFFGAAVAAIFAGFDLTPRAEIEALSVGAGDEANSDGKSVSIDDVVFLLGEAAPADLAAGNALMVGRSATGKSLNNT
ncbi:MAG TPA: hypothetical protein VIM63_15670 [Rhodoferax sp.]